MLAQRSKSWIGAVLAPFLLLLSSVAYGEDFGRHGCTVLTGTTFPITIDAPGIYCLASDLFVEGASDAIAVLANDVTIDGRGYGIVGPVGSEIVGRGIVGVDVSGITLRDLEIDGFHTAVLFGESEPNGGKSSFVHVTGVRAHDQSFQGIHLRGFWMSANDNEVIGSAYGQSYDQGTAISITGSWCSVAGNSIEIDGAQGTRVGIESLGGMGCTIEDNLVTFGAVDAPGQRIGIWTNYAGEHQTLVRNNLISGADFAFNQDGPRYENNVIFESFCGVFKSDISLEAPSSNLVKIASRVGTGC